LPLEGVVTDRSLAGKVAARMLNMGLADEPVAEPANEDEAPAEPIAGEPAPPKRKRPTSRGVPLHPSKAEAKKDFTAHYEKIIHRRDKLVQACDRLSVVEHVRDDFEKLGEALENIRVIAMNS